jgi:photosystem II stability/assembly factor-like uncharacterized protein
MTLKGTSWAPIGPSPIAEDIQVNGLVSAISVSSANPNIIYIGSAGGGVWRSGDGGNTWRPLFDRQLSLGVGEPAGLAVDPNDSDVVYVGTSGRITRQPQAGLFKSTDGGASWIRLGSGYPSSNTGNASQFVNQNVNVVIVDPANSNLLYLGSASGVFHSTDGGQNWTAGNNGFGDARSLVLDTSSPLSARILYAGLSGRGAFQSTDGGQNWTQILSGSTAAVSTAIGTPPPAKGFNKVVVAVAPPTSPPNPAGAQVLYVSLSGTGAAPDPVGLFISKDQGATWTQQTATSMPKNTQGGYSFHMAVDPASPGDGVNDIIYFGAVGQAKSTDSGVSFSSMPGMHSDTHAWAFVAQPSPTPSIVFCGNDGGINRSTDGGASWPPLNGGGLQTALFYNIDIKPDPGGSVTVGAPQDNGLQTTAGVPAPKWNSPQHGDGWDIAYDGVTAGRVYGTSGFWPAPCTRVFVSSADATDYPTTVPSGQDITPWGTTTDQGCGLFPVTTDPSTAGIVYASGNQNLWQSRDGGGSWRILSPFSTTGNIDVAPANGNNVVIAPGNQVFVSTNALAATVGLPTGVVFTNITRNLPPRNIARAVFDPNDPTIIYAVLGGLNGGAGNTGHVFRTSIGASTWTDISPLLDLPYSAIALDGTDTPTAIYVGTDLGVLRSVDGGSSWSVLDDLHFPRVPVLDLVLRNGFLRAGTYGRGVFAFVKPAGPSIALDLERGLAFGTLCKGPQFLTLKIFNVGGQDLIIDSVARLMGSPSFSVLSTPATPLVVEAGEEIEFTVVYTPTAAGVPDLATIRIISNDPFAPFIDLSATGVLGTSTLASAIADGGSFGDVCLGSFRDEEVTLNNSGSCPLVLTGITSSSPEFLTPNATYPLVVNPGASVDVVIRFQPGSFGAKSATLTLFCNDPSLTHTIVVSGFAPPPRLVLLIANSGSFGNVCVGSFRDEPLTLANSGRCTLSITSITSSSPEFLPPQISAFPVTIEAGGSLEIPIRFQPASLGAKSGTITIISDDPASPQSVAVSGNAPPGKLAVTGSLCFGGVRACRCAERTLTLCNVGNCDLHVTSVAFRRRNPHWKLIRNPFPATLHPGSCLGLVIRYKATEKCPRCCELVIKSDDPVKPVKVLDVMAYTIWDECGCKCSCEDCRKGCCKKGHKERCGCERHENCCCDDEEDDRRDHDDHHDEGDENDEDET